MKIINLVLIGFYIKISFENLYSNNNILEHNNNENHNLRDINLSNTLISKKNLILGVIQEYSLVTVLPFFKSIIRSKFTNCDVVIFFRKISQDLIEYIKRIGILSFEISHEYENDNIVSLRWKIYANYLNEKKNEYNLVFIADVRDTLFQSDIFKYYERHKSFLGLAIEDGTLNETSNRIWITNFVGLEKHKDIENERIICLGTLWGTLDKVLEFSTLFWEKYLSNTTFVDQGVANYLFYYEKLLKEFIVKSDNYGPVMTVGLTQSKNLILDNENNLLNFKGEIAAVIHQYDRKNEIFTKLLYKYCPEFNISDDIEFNYRNNNEKADINNFVCFYIFFIIILIIKYISLIINFKKIL